MDLLLIRQAETLPAGQTQGSDPGLSAAGRRAMRRSAQRLRLIEKRLDEVASSGLAASWQCAELVCATHGRLRPERAQGLEPGEDLATVVSWLQSRPVDSRLALVGNEPVLGRLLGLLLCGRPVRAVGLKRAGVCLARSQGFVGPGGFMLTWALTPGQLKAIKA